LEEYCPDQRPTLEAQIIDLADEIAYNNHDIDDGLKAGYLRPPELDKVELWCRISHQVQQKFPALDEERQIYQTISHLIGYLIMDLVNQTRLSLEQAGISDLVAVREAGRNLVGFSAETAALNRQLKEFLWHRLYRHYKVERMRVKAERFLTMLFEGFQENPSLLPQSYQEKFSRHGQERVICDYIAGMTDRYALDEYKRLFEPYERV
ncbi:MAG: deoxyguanosinetriphosphate triphosphohydrolase, partial [Desulfuromonas sp.]